MAHARGRSQPSTAVCSVAEFGAGAGFGTSGGDGGRAPQFGSVSCCLAVAVWLLKSRWTSCIVPGSSSEQVDLAGPLLRICSKQDVQ
jgi:hypothetical protein